MHILFVTLTLPVPTSSSRTRPFNLIKQLSQRHEISVLSLIQPHEYASLIQLEPYCEHIELVPFPGFKSRGKWSNRIWGWFSLLFYARPPAVRSFPIDMMREPLRRLIQSLPIEVVHFEHLYSVELLQEVGELPAVLGTQNVESEVVKKLYNIASNIIHKCRDKLTWKKILAFESYWVQRFSVCLFVSEEDAMNITNMAPFTEAYVVPNGVDTESFAPQLQQSERVSNKLLFFGTLNYGPNRDGIIYFCRDIWPKIRSARPDVKIEIVGIDPPSEVIALGRIAGVRVVGFVSDIRQELWKATLNIVPIRWGGGTRLKILEALAAECPTVSTSAGAEGLNLREGEEILIADEPNHFAQLVLDLLENPSKRDNLASAGRKAVISQYDWRFIAQKAEIAYARAIHLKREGVAE